MPPRPVSGLKELYSRSDTHLSHFQAFLLLQLGTDGTDHAYRMTIENRRQPDEKSAFSVLPCSSSEVSVTSRLQAVG